MKLRAPLILISAALIIAVLYMDPVILSNSDIAMLAVDDLETNGSIIENESYTYKELPLNSEPEFSTGSYTPLIDNINEYISNKKGTYGIYFISLTTGETFGINENTKFIAASTVKLPINLYLFTRISQNKVNPTRMLKYTDAFYEEGTGIIQDEDVGTKYSIRELSRLSIVYSDNIAINMLINFLGRNNILKFMDSIVHHTVSRKDNISSPKDMALYMKAVLDFYKDNEELGTELLNYLENTEFNDRIPRYIPENVPVAHKIGSQVNAVHDVGAVFAQKPFIISVMSRNVDEDEAPEVIGQIARMVYNFEGN